MEIGKKPVLRAEDQMTILRQVSNFHVSLEKIMSKHGANPIRTAIDKLFWESTTPTWITTKKRHFTTYAWMLALLFSSGNMLDLGWCAKIINIYSKIFFCTVFFTRIWNNTVRQEEILNFLHDIFDLTRIPKIFF